MRAFFNKKEGENMFFWGEGGGKGRKQKIGQQPSCFAAEFICFFPKLGTYFKNLSNLKLH